MALVKLNSYGPGEIRVPALTTWYDRCFFSKPPSRQTVTSSAAITSRTAMVTNGRRRAGCGAGSAG